MLVLQDTLFLQLAHLTPQGFIRESILYASETEGDLVFLPVLLFSQNPKLPWTCLALCAALLSAQLCGHTGEGGGLASLLFLNHVLRLSVLTLWLPNLVHACRCWLGDPCRMRPLIDEGVGEGRG